MPSKTISRNRTAQEILAEATLASSEEKTRFLKGFRKIKKLGDGGCGSVYLAKDEQGSIVAVKHIPKSKGKAGVYSGINEIRIGYLLYPSMRIVGAELKQHVNYSEDKVSSSREASTNIPNVAKFYRGVETNRAIWIVMEKGGQTLHNLLFQIKGFFKQGSRKYDVIRTEFFHYLEENPEKVKLLLKQLINIVKQMSARGIVHADIKPDNILIENAMDNNRPDIQSLRIIDFGSAFLYDRPNTMGSATPEYTPPEIISSTLSGKPSSKGDIRKTLRDRSLPHSVDMWSIGTIFLEILSGFPLWFSYKSRIQVQNKPSLWLRGLFATRNRDGMKILEKQRHVLDHLDELLDQYPGLYHAVDPSAIDLLRRMLTINPSERISPECALQHPYLRP